MTPSENNPSQSENGRFRSKGSKKAVNKVMDERQIMATDTEAYFIEP